MSPRSAIYRADTDYAVGLAADALVRVRDFGLAVPQVTYRPFQAVYPRGDITRAGDGPASVEWVWDVLYLEKVGSLIRYLFSATPVDTNLQSATCYIRTDRRVGWYSRPSQAFAVFEAIAWRPLLYGPDGSYANDTPYQVSTLRLMFKNLVEQ